MSNRDLSNFAGRALATTTGREQSDSSGRALRAEQNQAFPWTFPLWFTDVQIKNDNDFTGRDLSDG